MRRTSPQPEQGDSLAELERLEAARRRRRRRLFWACSPLLLFGAVLLAVMAGLFDRFDPDALRNGEFAPRASVNALTPHDSVTDPSPTFRRDVDGFVAMYNELNRVPNAPDLIVEHDIDSFGNLYVSLSPWYAKLSPRDQALLLDKLGRYYRSHLTRLLGSIPHDTSFTPGILVLDDRPGSLAAENRNGYVRIFARADTGRSGPAVLVQPNTAPDTPTPSAPAPGAPGAPARPAVTSTATPTQSGVLPPD